MAAPTRPCSSEPSTRPANAYALCDAQQESLRSCILLLFEHVKTMLDALLNPNWLDNGAAADAPPPQVLQCRAHYHEGLALRKC